MILDERNEFCDATALNTGGAGTYLIGDVMDLGSTGDDIGTGEPLYVVIQVTTAVTSGGSATVKFHVASDAGAAIAADGSETIHSSTNAIAKASLTAGATLIFPLPAAGSVAYERYLGIEQVTATAALTAGAVNAFITNEPHSWVAKADAVN